MGRRKLQIRHDVCHKRIIERKKQNKTEQGVYLPLEITRKASHGRRIERGGIEATERA